RSPLMTSLALYLKAPLGRGFLLNTHLHAISLVPAGVRPLLTTSYTSFLTSEASSSSIALRQYGASGLSIASSKVTGSPSGVSASMTMGLLEVILPYRVTC